MCDDNFNISSAHAICKEMGFEGALQWSSGQKWNVQTTFRSVMNHVKCPLPNWSSCSYTYSATVNQCGHHEDVFLRCSLSKSHFKSSCSAC